MTAAAHTAEDRRTAWLLFVALSALFLVFAEGAISGSDGHAMYEVTRSMVSHASVDVPKENGIRGVGGDYYYSIYGIGVPILAVPLYALSRPVAAVVGREDFVGQFFASMLMPFVCAALASATFLLTRRLGCSKRLALVSGVGTVAGTFALSYSKEFFSEPVSALGLTIAAERLLARRPLLAGFGLALAALARPQFFVAAAIFGLFTLVKYGLRDALRLSVGVGLAAIVSVAYNIARFSNWRDFGYGGGGFTTPLWEGVRGTLFSAEKSLFLFVPIFVLAPLGAAVLWKRDRLTAAMYATTVGAIALMAVTWHDWRAGWAWGPRFFITTVPFLVAAAALWVSDGDGRREKVFGALLAIGMVVSLPTLLVSSRAQQIDDPPARFGPKVDRQYALIGSTVPYTARHLTSYDAGEGDNYRYIATWQFGASRVLGAPGLAAAAVGTAALLFAAWYFGRQVVRP